MQTKMRLGHEDEDSTQKRQLLSKMTNALRAALTVVMTREKHTSAGTCNAA